MSRAHSAHYSEWVRDWKRKADRWRQKVNLKKSVSTTRIWLGGAHEQSSSSLQRRAVDLLCSGSLEVKHIAKALYAHVPHKSQNPVRDLWLSWDSEANSQLRVKTKRSRPKTWSTARTVITKNPEVTCWTHPSCTCKSAWDEKVMWKEKLHLTSV